MSGVLDVINLERYRELFRDEAAFNKFAKDIRQSLQRDLSPVVLDQRVIGAVLSEKGTKDVLYDRMVQRITERPELLAEIAERIESDTIVE